MKIKIGAAFAAAVMFAAFTAGAVTAAELFSSSPAQEESAALQEDMPQAYASPEEAPEMQPGLSSVTIQEMQNEETNAEAPEDISADPAVPDEGMRVEDPESPVMVQETEMEPAVDPELASTDPSEPALLQEVSEDFPGIPEEMQQPSETPPEILQEMFSETLPETSSEIPTDGQDSLTDTGILEAPRKMQLFGTPLQAGSGSPKGEGDGWELSMVYYDSMNGDSLVPLGMEIPVQWYAQKLYEYRQITLQVNYRNANTQEAAGPGELHIDVPDLKLLFTGGRETSSDVFLFTIAADRAGAEELKHDWSWSTWKDPDTGIPYYRLTNNRSFEERTNYEGSIQLSWRMVSQYGVNNVHIEACAVMNDLVRTQPFVMDFHSDEISISTIKEAKKLNSLDRLPAGEYYWVNYVFTSYTDSGYTGIRMVIPETAWYEDEFPPDCVVLDKSMSRISPSEGNTYRIPAEKVTLSYTSEKLQGECYVGYPVQNYAGKSFVNRVRLYGARYQQDCCHGSSSQTALVSEAECPVAAADFAFEYSGYLYSMTKKHLDHALSSTLIRSGEDTAWFYLYGSARYAGSRMNVQFGDDLPGILYNTGEFRLLDPGDYRFTSVSMPEFKNLNGLSLSDPAYRYNLYVKRRGKEAYELYASYETNQSRTVTFPETDPVCAFYVELEGLNESVNIAGTEKQRIRCCLAVHDENITSTGTLYNFSYMKVWINGQEVTQADLENYATEQTKAYIGEYDQRVHGKYLYRSFDSVDFAEGENGIYGKKSMTSFIKDAAAGQFQTDITLTFRLVRTNIGSFTDSFKGYEAFDLLPAGMELRKDKSPKIAAAGTSYVQYTRKQDGSSFEGTDDYSVYARRHTTITSQENWRGTGRTMVHIVVDYSDAPLNLLGLLQGPERADNFFRQEYEDLAVTYYAQVSFDNYLEFGNRYLNSGYTGAFGADQMTGVAERLYHPSYYVEDNGYMEAAVADLDGDGNTKELFSVSSCLVFIREAAATYQDVAVLVQTDRNNYNTVSGVSTPETDYTYKLRVRTGEERVTSLVIYDMLEDAYGSQPHWKGTLTGIDTSWAKSKGYQVRTWYTASVSAGSLSADPDSWSLYSADVDHESIKGLAFEFLDKKGAPAVVPSSSLVYVLVNMRSPADGSGAAFNRIYTQWNALDEFGRPVYDITGIHSNTVSVTLFVPNDPVTVSLTKEIDASDVVWETGAPVFFFRLAGTTEEGKARTFIKAAEFSPADAAGDGKLRKTLTFEAEPGSYTASEISTMRYCLEQIHSVQNGQRQGNEVLFRLGSGAHAEAVFCNRRTTDEGLTDTAFVRNIVG